MSIPWTLDGRQDERAVLYEVVQLACRAPSVHNTQPWLWRIRGNRIELHADEDRRLRVADSSGRSLTISCGAALHHARVAAAAAGYRVGVTRLPDHTDARHLATLELDRDHRSMRAVEELAALEKRCTDRRRFTAWPVPDERLAGLAASAGGDSSVHVVALTDASDRFRVELLVHRAMYLQDSDRRYAEEQAAWIDHSSLDGVPAWAVPSEGRTRPTRPSRYGPTAVEMAGEVVESSDGLLAVCTEPDGPEAWLRAGEALSTLWLQATIEGLSVVPLSQVIEMEETRAVLHHEVLRGLVAPQILVRIGWQQIGRRAQPRTPRRPVEDVLLR